MIKIVNIDNCRHGKYLFLTSFLLLLTSCTRFVEMDALVSDSIKYDDLRKGQLVFGGISDAKCDWKNTDILAYSMIALDGLLLENNGMKIRSAKWFMESVGEREFSLIHEKLRSMQPLDPELLQRVRERMGDVRYAMFSRLDRDETTETDNFSTIVSNPKTGETASYHEYITTRSTTIAVFIYDLQRAELAWFGSVRKKASNSNSSQYKESGHFFKDLAGEIATDTLAGLIGLTYPEPAPLNDMIMLSFQDVGYSFTITRDH